MNELSSSGVDESAGQNLCGTWSAGRAAHLLIDLTSEGPSGCTLQFFGSSTPAGAACPSALELLGESSPIASGGAMTYAAWSTQCVTLTPQFDTAFLELKPRANCGAFLAIDNIRQVASCP